MRLESIKLAGFKSFVDPTQVPFPGNLTAVVGPNGCGKSNIIDAVRWVMGESSAKQLRGESLDDVIFNGSTGRKPVGQASIELNFDNSEGKLEGQYASYAKIAIRREITRDGQSTYYLNGTKCRRKDITDLFLGTGMGARSYAIIEQGMISRVVEAKPDELRAYIEEAAGISRYKERRRETELRIKHTQENLARLNDLREEITKQLNHLQRQANAAERYTVLKQEERLLKAQIHALRWRLLSDQFQTQAEFIKEHEAELDTAIKEQQEIEAKLIELRELQGDSSHQYNEIQERNYQINNEITRLEQTLHHQRERRTQLENEKSELLQQWEICHQQLQITEHQIGSLNEEVIKLAPQHEQAVQVAEASQATLREAEQALHDWQLNWDIFNQTAAQAAQQVQVEQTRIHHLQQHSQTLEQRIARLQHEHQQQTGELNAVPAAELEQQLEELEQQQLFGEEQLQLLAQQINEQRHANQNTLGELDTAKSRWQTLTGQQASLEALQKAALGQQDTAIMNWLSQHQLADKSRLAQVIQVEAGWEKAVEVVLEGYLQAVCIDNLNDLATDLNQLPQGNLSLFTGNGLSYQSEPSTYLRLINKIQAPFSLATLLSGIYVAETLDEALILSQQLAANESVVTREGILLGNGWLTITDKNAAQTGILQRERELHELNDAMVQAALQVKDLQTKLEVGQHHLRELEEQRTSKQQQLTELHALQAELRAQQKVRQAHLAQLEQRAQQINIELQDCLAQLENDQRSLLQANDALQEAQAISFQQNEQRENLLQEKHNWQEKLTHLRQQMQHDRDVEHKLALQLQAARMQLESTQQAHTRLQQQSESLQQRQQNLALTLTENGSPLTDLAQQLELLIEQRQFIEEQLITAKQQVEQTEQQLRSKEKERHLCEQRLLNVRNTLEQLRLNGQASQVRTKSLEEQIIEEGADLTLLLTEMPAEANEKEWEERLSATTRKIERLGAINLAAIDEYKEQDERKKYLDAQYADLSDALSTLEDAMHKMDKETKNRFKETYDEVNKNFQAFFPRLFGGGRATLELVDADLLNAGVTMMAQPPGKRNSTIHLLSGGEKALTAIALVFSFFQLNPAPFCMLDEVDAPLDDANVGRFCNLVKEMSEKVQFIFISHNKLAIEMAHHLAGVTMHEAGVSRMVAVDVDEAIAMAEA